MLETQITLLILTFLAILVAFFREQFWDWYRRPIVEVRFKLEYPYLKKTKTHFLQDVFKESIWIRLEIHNSGKTVAKGCEVWLEELEKHDTHSLRKCIPFDPIVLHWVGYPILEKDIYTKEWVTNDIKPKSSYLVDIGFITADNNELCLETSIRLERATRYNWPKGWYRFKGAVYGDNFKPVPFEVSIITSNYDKFNLPDPFPTS